MSKYIEYLDDTVKELKKDEEEFINWLDEELDIE